VVHRSFISEENTIDFVIPLRINGTFL